MKENKYFLGIPSEKREKKQLGNPTNVHEILDVTCYLPGTVFLSNMLGRNILNGAEKTLLARKKSFFSINSRRNCDRHEVRENEISIYLPTENNNCECMRSQSDFQI